MKAVFFDIGGTLVEKGKNTQRDEAMIAEMAALLGLDCTPAELIETINTGEKTYKAWRNQTLHELPVDEKWSRFLLPHLDTELVKRTSAQLQTCWSLSKGLKKVKAEAASVLKELDVRGYTLGTISHSTPGTLEKAGLTPLFKARIHASQFGRRKPHPALFIDAARQCGLAPQECAYVGDNPWWDVVGPREAGFGMVVLMKNGSNHPVATDEMMQPDLVIHSLRELLPYFREAGIINAENQQKDKESILYDAALSTMWWDKEKDSADEFFDSGRRLGFARFELNHQVPPQLLEEIDTNRFSIASLHDPCPAVIPAKVLENNDIQITSLDENRRRQGIDVVKRTIEQACKLHARHVVVHPGRIICDHSPDDCLRELYRAGKKGTTEYEEARLFAIADRARRVGAHLDRLLESLGVIIDFTKDTGLTIGLENRFHYYELPIYEEMRIILNTFTEPWVGWQFDIGHLQVHHALGLMNMQDWYDSFSQRIVGVHIHDVQGIKDHQAPGSGDVDFDAIARYLPVATYRALEVDKSIDDITLAKSMEFLASKGCITRIL